MYHYTECGLANVWLTNGYKTIKTQYGKATAVENMAALHRAIGTDLALHHPRLTSAEFRFLRKELGLSQAQFGQLFDYEDQSVALWERKGRLPKWADRMIRLLYLEKTAGNAKIAELVEQLNDRGRQEHAEKHVFQETAKGWMPKAA